MVIVKAIMSLFIAGIGIYLLTHVKNSARSLQNFYVRQTQKVQERKGLGSYLPMNNPEYWKSPFATILFKAMIIFFGIWLIIVAYPIVFGAVTF